MSQQLTISSLISALALVSLALVARVEAVADAPEFGTLLVQDQASAGFNS